MHAKPTNRKDIHSYAINSSECLDHRQGEPSLRRASPATDDCPSCSSPQHPKPPTQPQRDQTFASSASTYSTRSNFLKGHTVLGRWCACYLKYPKGNNTQEAEKLKPKVCFHHRTKLRPPKWEWPFSFPMYKRKQFTQQQSTCENTLIVKLKSVAQKTHRSMLTRVITWEGCANPKRVLELGRNLNTSRIVCMQGSVTQIRWLIPSTSQSAPQS